MDEHLPRGKGLVLIELIVVVAILAIIAAMLMPVYANARKKARQVRCAGSLHQIGMAVSLYLTDYDCGWPAASASPWGTALRPYLRTDYLKLGCSMTRRGAEPIRHVPGYAMNSGIFFQSARDPEIQFPSRTVSFCDAPWEIALTASPDPWMTVPRPRPAPESAWRRHQGGGNYLFCDQHIKWYRPDSVLPAWIHNRGGEHPTFAVSWKP